MMTRSTDISRLVAENMETSIYLLHMTSHLKSTTKLIGLLIRFWPFVRKSPHFKSINVSPHLNTLSLIRYHMWRHNMPDRHVLQFWLLLLTCRTFISTVELLTPDYWKIAACIKKAKNWLVWTLIIKFHMLFYVKLSINDEYMTVLVYLVPSLGA